ncbi:MAG: hypothetical protein ABW321_25505 [Polyangiales bacterium]
MRAEQRWIGLTSGLVSRAIRFLSTFAIATACLRAFGASTWGTVAVAIAAAELSTFADFALPELCVFAAARARDRAELQARIGQVLWLSVPPAALCTLALLGAAYNTPLWFHGTASEHATLRQVLTASACGSPLLLIANCYAGTLQGLGHLREVSSAYALSSLIELGMVLGLLALACSPADVQWARAASQLFRLACTLLCYPQLRIAIPRPETPLAAELRELARYSAGRSLLKLLGGALSYGHLPVVQAFTTTATLGAYDATNRLGSVLQRAANPVWDSLFQRLVRSFDSGANAAQRAAGRRDFLAGTQLLVALSAIATLATLNLAPWLFPLWLGASLADEPVRFAPWVMATWSLSLGTGMCTAVLAARPQLRAANVAHALAVMTTLASVIWWGPRDGRFALLAGPALGNTVLALGLVAFACRSAEVPLGTFVRGAAAIWAPAGLALLAPCSSLVVSGLLTLAGTAGVALVTIRAEPVRSLARDFRNAAASTPPTPPSPPLQKPARARS